MSPPSLPPTDAVTRHLTSPALPLSSGGCRVLFATHYHTLCDDFAGDAAVALAHMGCIVSEAAGRGGSGSSPSVTFLYKLLPGACPKSYGLNVARLAGLPEAVMRRAGAKSAEFEAAIVAAEAAAGAGDRSGGAALELRRRAEALLAQLEAGEAEADGDTALVALFEDAVRESIPQIP